MDCGAVTVLTVQTVNGGSWLCVVELLEDDVVLLVVVDVDAEVVVVSLLETIIDTVTIEVTTVGLLVTGNSGTNGRPTTLSGPPPLQGS